MKECVHSMVSKEYLKSISKINALIFFFCLILSDMGLCRNTSVWAANPLFYYRDMLIDQIIIMHKITSVVTSQSIWREVARLPRETST